MSKARQGRASRLLRIGAITGAVAITAAACGSGTPSATSKTTSGAGTTASSASSGGAQTVKIITWVNPPAVNALKKIDAEFQKKYPNIHVQLQTAVNVTGPYATLQQTSVAAHSTDIITNVATAAPYPVKATKKTMTQWQYWTANKVFLSLNGQPWVKDLTPAAVKNETYKGKLYGAVSGDYQYEVFYNKADFAKHHISVPKTWNQFITVLNKFKADGVKSPIYLATGGGAPEYTLFMYYPLMSQIWAPQVPNGNLSVALQKGTTKWTSSYFTTVMKKEQTLAKYFEPNWAGVNWQGMPGEFANNAAPMLLDGSWDLAAVQKANPKIQVGAFPLPGTNDPSLNKGLYLGNLTFSILRQAPDKAAALKWLDFFETRPVYEQYVNITGISPTQPGGTYNNFTAKALGSTLGKGVDVNKIFPPLPSAGAYYDQQTHWNALQEQVVQGQKAPQAAQTLYQKGWKG